MKIATNLSLAVQMLAFSEGVLLAEKSGIARETAVDVLTHSAIASPMVQYRGPFVLKMPDEAWFNVNMMQKDMLLALELGRQVGCAPAHHRRRQRIPDRRARDGPGGTGFRHGFQRAGTNVRSRKMSTATDSSKTEAEVETERWLRMYRRMLMIRLFEEQVNDLYTRALMPGLAHLYIGEEAVAVGVCEALRAGRLHHQYASRSRALRGEGSRAGPDVRRAAGQGSRATAKARADRCTSPIRTRATWAQTRLSREARESPRAPRLRRSAWARGKSRFASSARARWDRACSTK